MLRLLRHDCLTTHYVFVDGGAFTPAAQIHQPQGSAIALQLSHDAPQTRGDPTLRDVNGAVGH